MLTHTKLLNAFKIDISHNQYYNRSFTGLVYKNNIKSPYLVFKRYFPGGKPPVGHVHKLISTLNKGKIQPAFTELPRPNATKIVEQPFDKYLTNQSTVASATVFDKIEDVSRTGWNSFKTVAKNSVNPTSILTPHSPHVLQNKESILTFLAHFSEMSLEQLNDEKFLLNYLSNLTKDPKMLVRAYQLCLEIAYKKRLFSENNLEQAFAHDKLSIIDLVGRNNHMADSSTIYTASQVHHMLNNDSASKAEFYVIISTCVKAHDLTNVPQNISTFMQYSVERTGNTLCDVQIDGIHYDFKTTLDISYGKNLIYFFSYEEIQSGKLSTYFININKVLKSSVNVDKMYIGKIQTHLTEIINDKHHTNLEKLEYLNKCLFNLMHSRPPGVNIPIIIPTTKKSFIPKMSNELLSTVELPVSKSLQPNDVYKAIMGVSKTWDRETARNAFIETHGVLGSDKMEN